MESPPQRPKPSRSKTVLVATRRSAETGERNETPADGRKRKMRKFSGRSPGIELDPRPSDDADDPLNWPRWKKETTYGSLLLTTATVCVLKTIYVTTNSVIATEYNSSYMATTATTGLPFIIAAFSSLGSNILSQVIGKRIILIVSSFMMLVGVLWNMHIMSSYGWFMVSRLMQAVGWGATEGVVLISIRDVFFVHERSLRMSILNIISLVFTWGSPILGGYVSQSNDSFRNQLMIFNIIQALAVVFVIFFVSETSFDRSKSKGSSLASAFGQTTATNMSVSSGSRFNTYLKSLHPLKYTAPFSLQTAVQPLHALSAPSALLGLLLTGPMVASSYGVANSLSMLFATMPTFLFPSHLGCIFILPLVCSIIAYILTSYICYLRYKPPHHLSRTSTSDQLAAALPGILLGVSGLLSFGLYIEGELSSKTIDKTTVFALDTTGANISFKIVSLLFGMLVAGSTLISFPVSVHLASSSSLSSSNYGETILQPSHSVLENLLIGIFIIGFPVWVQGTEGMMEGIKNTAIAISVLQIVLYSTVGALLFVKGDSIRVIDRRVLGIREDDGMGLQRWKSEGSFFEA